MTTPWSSIEITAAADPWSTVYGFMIDHIWVVNGNQGERGYNVARRPHWPDEMYIHVLKCYDLEPPNELSEGATHWVFFDTGEEYNPSAEDLAATDWLIGELDDEVECLV